MARRMPFWPAMSADAQYDRYAAGWLAFLTVALATAAGVAQALRGRARPGTRPTELEARVLEALAMDEVARRRRFAAEELEPGVLRVHGLVADRAEHQRVLALARLAGADSGALVLDGLGITKIEESDV